MDNLQRLDSMSGSPLWAVDISLIPRGTDLRVLPGQIVPTLGPNAIQCLHRGDYDAIGCIAGWISDE